MNVNLYPEMNQKIVQILRISNEPSCQYAAALIESLQAQLAKEKQRADRAEKVLELIKRDINEQDKIYIHIADFFGRGIYIDEEGDAE